MATGTASRVSKGPLRHSDAAADPRGLAAAESEARDRAALDAVLNGALPSLRVYRPSPAASIGRHQTFAEELRVDYCRRHGIAMLRRITGGGALYHDGGQLAFSLAFANPKLTLAAVLEQGARAIAAALSDLGVAAHFKFPNDVEVDGRKLASVFAHGEQGAWLLQASVILKADVKAMLEALRVPTEKLSADGLAAARDRLAPLSDLARVGEKRLRENLARSLADAFELDAVAAPPRKKASAPRLRPEPPTDGYEGLWRTPGGVLHARVLAKERVAAVHLTGGVHVHPATLLTELEQALSASVPAELQQNLDAFFDARPDAELVGFTVADLRQILAHALTKSILEREWGLTPKQADAIMLIGNEDPAAILGKVGMVLVPYCAKAPFCGHRNRDTCAACGKCAVGEAYRLARERRLPIHTILSYEHLVNTLREMQAAGIQAYIGMCCRDFFIKRQQAFRDAGMSAVLMDISGANCYELKQEDQAYAGEFKAVARLDMGLTRKVMKRVRRTPAKK